MKPKNGEILVEPGPDTESIILRMLQETPSHPGTWQQSIRPGKRRDAISQL